MHPDEWLPELLPRLRRYARVLARGDRTRADDLVQDCVERALSRLHLWREGSDRRTWMFTIMHNLHVNQARRSARAPDRVPLDDDGALSAPAADPEERVFLQQLAGFMSALPEEQSEVLYLVAVEGLRYREVADTLKIPEGTVMSRLARARDTLRARLQDPNRNYIRRIK